MQIIHTIKELREWRKTAGKVAFVPTMGNLHEGHLALVREAKKRADNVVVSILSTACNSDKAKISTNIRALCNKMPTN